MKVIVASRYAVEVVDLEDPTLKRTIRTANYETLYYGITWNQDNMFLARRDLDTGKCGIEVLDRDLEYVDTIFYGRKELNDLHQIHWLDDHLWITSSGINAIVRANLEDNHLTSFFPDRSIKYRDVNHFNSFWYDPDLNEVCVVAHNLGKSEVWRLTYPELMVISIRTGMGTGTHNVVAIGGHQYALSSGGGYVTAGGANYPLHGNKYPRGLAVTPGGSFIVGRSEHTTDRSQRHIEMLGAVQEYNYSQKGSALSLKYKKTVELNHGMVFEIRLLDELDIAHHGQRWI